MNDDDFTSFLILLFLSGVYSENKFDANNEKEGKRDMNLFEKLIRDGFVEVGASALKGFERAIGCCTMLKVDKVCAKTEAHLILVGKYDQMDRVEIISGKTYFYDPSKWVLSKSVVENDINKGWHDDIKLDERSKEILDSIWPVIHGRVMQMIDCGQCGEV